MEGLTSKVVARGNSKAFDLKNALVKLMNLQLGDEYEVKFKTRKGKKIITLTEIKE